jgi:hypothetical protein
MVRPLSKRLSLLTFSSVDTKTVTMDMMDRKGTRSRSRNVAPVGEFDSLTVNQKLRYCPRHSALTASLANCFFVTTLILLYIFNLSAFNSIIYIYIIYIVMSSPDKQPTDAEPQSEISTSDPPANDHIDALEPQRPTDWAAALKIFLKDIGFEETAEALDTELIILSNTNRAKIPKHTVRLVDNLLSVIEADAESEPLSEKNDEEKIEGSNAKRKRSDEDDEDMMEDRIKRMSPEQVQIRATSSDLRKRIESFIQAKKSEVDASNRTEFMKRKDTGESDVTCARTDAREIDRSIQMKFDVVNNEDGPLARSLVTSANHVSVGSTVHKGSGAEERLQNMEQHLNIVYKNNSRDSFTLFQRMKIIEDTIIQIEQQNPLWAAIHFNQPNRTFPPPPVVNLITPTESATEKAMEQKSYTSDAVSHTPHPQLKPTGRANSSLTRAVIEQLARRQQQS